MTDPRNESNSTAKLTHDVILDGGMCVDEKSGLVKFFSKSRLKLNNDFVGPLVFDPKNIDPRLLNLLLYSPILYQATQRAKLDAIDLKDRIAKLSADVSNPEQQYECLNILAQIMRLQNSMEIAQKAARDGIDLRLTPLTADVIVALSILIT